MDAERADSRLRYREEYVLRIRQRPRESGGGRAWTWFLARHIAQRMEKELVSLAAAHGRRHERTDDLERAVERARQRPMFGGVRVQTRHALRRAAVVWRKTHATHVPIPGALVDPLPWFNGRPRIFD